MSKSEQAHVYDFGPFRLNATERTLLRDGEPVKLTPKVIDTLVALVERSGRIVAKDDLMEAVWPGTFVEESNLASNVSLLRKALGNDADGRPYIETLSKRGYRFISQVNEVALAEADMIVRRRTTTRIVTHHEESEGSLAGPVAPKATSVFSLLPVLAGAETPGVVLHTSGARSWSRWLTVAALTFLLFVICGFAFGLYRLIQYRSIANPLTGTFGNAKVVRLTTSGKATIAGISPDGKYVVHVLGGAGQQSLWLRHIDTGSDKEIVPSNGNDFLFLTFAPDGGHIFYVRVEAGNYPLYQVAVLGGPPKNIIGQDVDTPITFSPDGRRFAFMRGQQQKGEVSLVVANADGSQEQNLVTRKPGDFVRGSSWPWPSWSPDGKTIAFAHRTPDAAAKEVNVITVSVSDGVEKQITTQKWSAIGALAWLADGSGLVITAADEEPRSTQQLWLVSYPTGAVRRITNDTNNYRGLSLTADSRALVTIQTDRASNIWTVASGEANRAVEITSNRSEGLGGVVWTPNGRIVYTHGHGEHRDIWIMNADGTNQHQLTSDAGGNNSPSISRDGRYVLFSSTRTGINNIWRMDIDGANARQLTNGRDDQTPDCSPDGHSVVYCATDHDMERVRIVSIDGGDDVQLTNHTSSRPRFSPDGKSILCGYVNEQESPARWRLAIINLAGEPSGKAFDIPFQSRFQWAADGQALLYSLTRNGIANIWSQPLAGGPPKQLTDFRSDQIFQFDKSRDGKKLVLARGTVVSDVVLLSWKQL